MLKKDDMKEVTIVGGGLAGSEAAWQLARRGVRVRLLEMRPGTQTGAHRSGDLGEVVCSNSFKSTLEETASGLLKAELDVYGCWLLEVARRCAVPAGHALGIDRELFAGTVTAALESHDSIGVERARVDSLDLDVPVVVATGPLTAEALSKELQNHCSSEHLYFYDAISPSIDGDSVDPDAGFWASRYNKGTPDYLNLPLDEKAYNALIKRIVQSEYAPARAFEKEKYFDACMPIEEIVNRGADTLRHGPMKPKGLVDPGTGQEPYAVIQLRQESREGNLLGLVGFQTRMTRPAQKELIRSLPGLAEARIMRYGSIHRNMYLDVPRICRPYQVDKKRPGLYYAGQICGVEGYVESIASGLVAALSVFADLHRRDLPSLPPETMIGALMGYVHAENEDFQPMNANMGIMPRPARRRGGRKARNQAIAKTAVSAAEYYRKANPWLF